MGCGFERAFLIRETQMQNTREKEEEGGKTIEKHKGSY